MKVLVTGSRGLVGSALIPALEGAGHEVARLSRGGSWNPEAGVTEPAAVAGADAVVHLAGENLAAGRWTVERKRRIRESRANGTRALANAIAALPEKPRVLVSASAVGYYGNRGDEILTEDSPPGRGFLADVCRAWEDATSPAANAGVRVVCTRFGMILSGRGGALERMLPVFRRGAGGPIGNGRQYVSWIALDDVVSAILHSIDEPGLSGPVNAVAPEPVRNSDFAHALGHVLGRPAVLHAPAFMLKIAFGGEMVEQVLLASQRAVPRRLTDSGFRFRHAEIQDALRSALQR